jgi:hypothetical protein
VLNTGQRWSVIRADVFHEFWKVEDIQEQAGRRALAPARQQVAPLRPEMPNKRMGSSTCLSLYLRETK